MSTVKQIADAEALRAEAGDENGDDEQDGDAPALADESDQPAELGEPSKEQVQQLEHEIADHLTSVRSIMGGHVEGFGPCDTCGGMGLVPPTPPPVHYANFKECDTCNGYGAVLTGARNPENANVNCPRCAGRGYLERTIAPPTPPAPPVEGGAPPAEAPDEWGVPSWMGDPAIRPGA